MSKRQQLNRGDPDWLWTKFGLAFLVLAALAWLFPHGDSLVLILMGDTLIGAAILSFLLTLLLLIRELRAHFIYRRGYEFDEQGFWFSTEFPRAAEPNIRWHEIDDIQVSFAGDPADLKQAAGIVLSLTSGDVFPPMLGRYDGLRKECENLKLASIPQYPLLLVAANWLQPLPKIEQNLREAWQLHRFKQD